MDKSTRKHHIALKKNLLLTLGLLVLLSVGSDAANRYWIGGTGSWNEKSHWSLTSGGAGGAELPTQADDVFFDQHSFSADRQTVMVNSDAVCRNLDWSAINQKVIFSSHESKSLTVYGSYTLSPLIMNGFKGRTVFASAASANSITSAGNALLGEWIFNGTGSWQLSDELNGEQLNIRLMKGTLNTNDKKVTVSGFNGNSTASRTLNLGASEIFVKQLWDLSEPAGIHFNSGTSRIIFDTSVDNNNFRSGGLGYNSVSAMMAPCSPSGQLCANFTITLTATDVRCNGLNNGTVTASVVGGSGNFNYNWDGGAVPAGEGTDSIFNLGAGNHTVQVIDITSGAFCFCNINVLEPGLLFDYELFHTRPLCNGNTNGSIGVDATGGTFPYTYSWAPGVHPANDTVTGLGAGTYTITVTDVKGCTASTTVVLTEPPVLLAPGTANMVTCFGLCNGTASVNVSGGTAPYNYNWNSPATPTPPGDGTPNITNLCPNSYTCTVTDTNGCVAVFDTIITQPPVLTLNATSTDASCGGICDGTATATVSGGTTPYLYIWSTGSSVSSSATTNTITGLCAANSPFIIQVTDAKGCFIADTAIVNEPPVLVATATGNNTSCFDICNGTATAIVTGGTAGYSYNWNGSATPPGDGTPNISGLCPGTYTVDVTDINGCNDTAVVTITEPALLVANPTGTDVLCFGDCNGTATATPVGGTFPYTYNWNGSATPTGDGTPNIINLCAGTYSVLVTDAHGCDTLQTVTVTQPPLLVITMTRTNVTCNGFCNGTATATPAGGTGTYSYDWTSPVTATPSGDGTPTITGLCPGTYTVVVTDANNCTTTATIIITQPNPLAVSISATALLCNGDCNATAAATVSGGTATYTFDWSGTPPGDGTNSINSLCAGGYTVNVLDFNNCPATANVTISQPTALVINTSSTNVTCFGMCNGTASVIAGGGTPGYQYSWAPGGQTTTTITDLCVGTYTVTVKDANGCTQTTTVAVSSPPQLLGNPSVGNNVSCAGLCNGVATSAATGGTGSSYSYNWNGAATPAGDGTPTITGLCAGTYTLMVTDSNSCTSTQTVTITQPLLLSAPITGQTSSCNICNGTATVTPAGGTAGYTYAWQSPSQTTQTAVGLCPNVTYTVTVTDANGCTAANTVTILPTITITLTTSNTTLSCFGSCDGIATANAAGGQIPYNYLWVNSGGTVATTQTATGLCAGTYTVTVVDANGCLNTAIVTFTNPPLLNVSATHTNVTCGGACNGTATASATGGTGAHTYSWSTSPAQTTATATGLCAGTYVCTVQDVSGCTDTVMVTITEPSVIVDNAVITDANCLQADGSISATPTGGVGTYSYLWTPAGSIGGGQGTPTATGLLPGAYALQITDATGCIFNFNYLLNNVNGPTHVMVHTNVSCNNACDGTATVTASGGAGGYTYNWNGAATPAGDGTPTITSLCGTVTYTVAITDIAGCIGLDTATVRNPLPISAHQVVVNETCGGLCNGSITLNPTGGTGGYTYSWTSLSGPLPPTASQTGLCATNSPYTVTITDVNGCDTTLVINITSPPVLVVSMAFTNVLCNSACNGTAAVTATGGAGSGTYTYSWSQGASFVLPNVVNLCPGTYVVTVSDGTGCTAVDSVQITEPTPLTSFTSATSATCNGVCNGTATVVPSGGTLPYDFLWSSGDTTATAIGLCAGSYNPVVTDSNGCVSAPPPVVILQPVAIVPTITTVNPSCNGSCNGTASAVISGGTAPYTYSWAPGVIAGQGTPNATGLCGISYVLTVTDSMGCSNNQNISLLDPPTLNANPASTSPTCANSCNGSVAATPVGGTSGYTYLWSPGGATTQTVNSLCPQTYTVIVTDTNSCKDTQTVVVNNPLPINVVVGSTPANCGVCDGTITLTPITGVPPYTYVWTPAPGAGGTPTASGTAICAGLYNILVTDWNGCDSSFTVPMNNSGGVTGETVATVPATCNTFCDGQGSVVPVGGTAPFTYLWNDTPPTANDTAINLCAGNYFVAITDSNVCVHFSPVSIAQPAPIVANASITNAVCTNVCTGAISLAPTGGTAGYTYLWSPAADITTGQGTANVSGLCPGTYTVLITDTHMCVHTETFTIGQSTPLTVAVTSANISCSNACSGTAFVNISTGLSPYTIQWSDLNGQTNDTASALCAGTYTVNVSDANGCVTSLSTTITATPAVIANASITNAGCGACDGSAIVVPTGGTFPYSFLWSNGQTSAAASNLCSGLYTVNITDGANCTTSFPIPVSNLTGGPASLNITSTNVTCNGGANGAVTAVTPVGGIPPYSFLWIGSGATTSTLGGLTAGVYYVQVSDSTGCSIVDSVTITEPARIMANQVITAATCGVCDGTITINPSGGVAGYTVLWNNSSTSLSLTNLCAGIYSVQITDAAGCSVNSVIPLNNFNAPSITMSSTNAGCNNVCDGTATVTATGGMAPYGYSWNDLGAQTTPTATSLCDGTYAVTVTGADGCIAATTVTITEPDPIGFSIANAINPFCNGDTTGSITVIPSGGTLSYTYSWSPGGGTGLTETGLAANTYIVTVTDANGCAATQTTTLTQTASLAISHVATNPSCNTLPDGSINVTVTGGALPYSYQWSGSSTATTEDLASVYAGTYIITVTDANGCIIADTIVLTPVQTVIANAGNDTVFCQNGSIILSAAGSTNGVNYQWFEVGNSTSLGNTLSISVNPPSGSTGYYVVVDNGTGCPDSDTLTVTSNALPNVNAGPDVTIVIGQSAGIGGSPTTVTGGATLLWRPLPGLDNATIANPTASPTSTTVYTVTVTSAEGCIASDSMVVTVLPTIIIPDGISPNGDGQNDEWLIDGIEMFPNCNVEVYNRWGELLFQSPGYKEHWKGTYRGQDLPVGTYYYIIDLGDPLYPDAYTGPITILR